MCLMAGNLKGEYIEITPAKTKGTQVFGLMNLNNQLQSYAFEGSMTSKVVIAVWLLSYRYYSTYCGGAR